MFEAIHRGLQVATRTCRTSPAFCLFAAFAVALGVGVSTAAYSGIYAEFWRTLAIADGDRTVVLVRNGTPASPIWFSIPDLTELRRRQSCLTNLAAWTTLSGVIVGDFDPVYSPIEAVSGNYFSLLGVQPQAGRLLSSEDDRPDAERVIVVSNALWQGSFHSDRAIVGRRVQIGGLDFTVVGIAPRTFLGASRSSQPSQVWMALQPAGRLKKGPLFVEVLGRLAPTATANQAEAQLNSVRTQLASERQAGRGDGSSTGTKWTVQSLSVTLRPSQLTAAAYSLLVLPALLLTLSCATLASLIVSRSIDRAADIVVRTALGATRSRIIVHQLWCVVPIILVGGALGIGLASLILAVLRSQVTPIMSAVEPGFALTWRLEPAVLMTAMGMVIVCIVVSGLLPAMWITRRDVQGRVNSLANRMIIASWRGRANAIALQVAVSVLLSIAASVAASTIAAGARSDPFHGDPRSLAVAYIPLGTAASQDALRAGTFKRIQEAVSALPGVDVVAAGSYLPMRLAWPAPLSASGSVSSTDPRVETGIGTRLLGVSASTFRALGLKIAQGTQLSSQSPNDVVITPGLANRLYADVNPVGKEVFWTQGRGTDEAEIVHEGRIVGVLDSPRVTSPSDSIGDVLLVSPDSISLESITVAVKSLGPDAGSLVPAIRRAVQDANVPATVLAAGRLDEMQDARVAVSSRVSWAGGLLALTIYTLTILGLYGVVSHIVILRYREIALRMTLGASRLHVALSVARDALRPVAEGALIALISAFVIVFLFPWSTQVTAPSSTSIARAAIGAVVMGTIAGVASYLPARRAAEIDPGTMLRNL